MKEIFKDIPGYEDYYQISSLGRVRSLTRTMRHPKGLRSLIKGRIMKSSPDGVGYLKLILCKNGVQKIARIHILVAVVFKGHKPDGTYKGFIVDHIDNVKTNNCEWNIQLITARENCSKDRKGYTSKYIGVSWYNRDKKWASKISINGKNKFLGYYKNELKASKEYQKALKKLNQ